ncbi:MAG TPA: DUF2330 domain-containing protein [Deltaproteobacteria bacterium]|nr:DUF2330 domain-containing protein [Deltaproteobacteria bacterium]
MILLYTTTQAALACAGLVHADGVLAESDAAEVVLDVANQSVTATYRVIYDGDAAELGWILPLFGEIEAIGDGDPDLLADLRERTAPYVAVAEPSSAGCGCSGEADADKAGGRSTEDGTPGVEIIAQGFTGTYEWTAIAADEAQLLSGWFSDQGFVPPPDEDLEHYLGLGATMLAVTITPQDAQTPEEGRNLPPLAVTTRGEGMLRFPSILARSASAPTQRTTVYLRGPDRGVLAEGWTHQDLHEVSGPKGAAPAEVLDDALLALGADRIWARTFAEDHTDGYITRFDLLAPREVHTVDAVFGFEEISEDVHTIIRLGEGSQALLLLLPFVGLGLASRRR